MGQLKIIIEPDPRYGKVSQKLRQKAAPIDKIDDSIRKLAADMFETMMDANGVGLAAPQVGIYKRLVVIHVPAGYENEDDPELNLTLINPELVKAGGQEFGPEGCLSFPDLVGELSRYASVTVRAKDENGRDLKIKARGLLARALQHEIDHLDGILFFDRMPDYSTLFYPPTEEELEELRRQREREEADATARTPAD